MHGGRTSAAAGDTGGGHIFPKIYFDFINTGGQQRQQNQIILLKI